MYSKKYRLEKIEEFNRHNPIYDDMEGCICYPVYFNIGERGWFLHETDDWFDLPHRVHTSKVKNVEYFNGTIIVETKNTKFIFIEVKGDE